MHESLNDKAALKTLAYLDEGKRFANRGPEKRREEKQSIM